MLDLEIKIDDSPELAGCYVRGFGLARGPLITIFAKE